MPDQGYYELLAQSQADSTALTASVTPTSILHATGKVTLPAGFFNKIGKKFVIKAEGRVSNIITTPGTLTLDVRLGAVIAANGGAMTLNIVAKTNVPWWLVWELTVRSVGSGTAATLMHQGLWTSESVIGSPLPTVGGVGSLLIPVVTPAVGTGFDSTAAQTVDLFGTWSLNNANSILTHQSSIESLN